MEKSHLVSIFRVLNKKETKEMRKWVNSPAHNLRQDVADLFEYLVAGQHLFSEKHLEKERVFQAIYPNKTYHDAEMRQVMHFLLKAVENFLVYHELLKDETRAQTILAKVYRQRQLPKLFQKTMEASQKTQEQQPYRNHQYFENEFFLQFEQYSYLSGLGRDVPLNIQEVSDANDVSYLANKLKLSCIMLSHQAVFKTEYRLHLLDDLVKNVESSPHYLTIPAIAIYYYSYKAVTQAKDTTFFGKLKNEIFEHGGLFPPDEMRTIYLLAINYCIGRINVGQNEFIRESFELYREGMAKNIFLENGIMSRFTFGNAIRIALNLQEFDWVENIIQHHSQWLEEKHRENYVRFYLARLHFERKNYDEAMKLFAQSDFDDILMSLHAKTMLLKIYYELDEFYALDSLLESMRTYLQRKKVMGYHRSIYKNLILYTKKLLKLPPRDRGQIQKLRSEIETAEPLMERKWLLAQLDNL